MEYLIIGYLLGSIPFGLVLCFVCGYGDIRKIGSGNIGATNVLRTGSKTLALLTLIADISKGGIAVLIAQHFASDQLAVYAGLLAIVGHNHPIWLKFKGGKGIATTIGTILFISPVVAGFVIATWLLVAFLFRYSSLAGITSLLISPIAAYFTDNNYLILPFAIIAVMAVVKHRENIRRLIDRTEAKINK